MIDHAAGIALAGAMKTWLQTGIIGCLALLITLLGVMEPIERALLTMRFSLDTRQASGDLVVVQIDARTIRDIGVWPFARSDHAQVIDHLREAGASSIALDIELTRSTDDADNAILVAALERAGGQIILPSFIQLASAGQESKDTIRTEPAGLFLTHAWLANVNVYPSSDGRIWTMTYGGWIGEEFRYSLAATLAGRAKRDARAFYVDYSIDLTTIPRLSYIDILNGTVDPSLIEGKQIIIGGTAVELGDQLNLPVVGVVSGPVLQALAFETIYQHREIWRTSLPVSLVLALFTLLLLSWGRSRTSLSFYIFGVLLFCATAEGAAIMVQRLAAVSVDTGSILLVATCMGIAVTMSELDKRHTQVAHERIEKENRGRMLARVIQDSFDGLIIFDEERCVEGVNAAARKILALEQDLVLDGSALIELIPEWEKNHPLVWNAEASNGADELQELALVNRSGSELVIEFVITRSVLDGVGNEATKPIYTLTFRDITKRRRAEEERDVALQEAIAANTAKTQFLANMSHELRTPLNAIIGFSEIMGQQLFGPLGSEQYVGYAGDIEGSGRHLLSIVNDILDVSRIETGEFVLNEYELDVDDLFRAVHRLAEGWPATKERNIIIDVEDGLPELWADERLFKQMVLNLLSNAVKFSAPGSTVTLSASLNTNNCIVVRVKDEGIGIPEECLPKLTEAFYQVDATLEREFEGSGLGLTLVHQHMELHGGRLTFESEVGTGTTAILVFPTERTHSSELRSQPA